MVEIRFNDDSAEIDLHGAEEFLAVKKQLVIPYTNIETVDDNADEVHRYMKVLGSAFGVDNHLYGRFTTNDGLGFFVLKKEENAFAIHLRNESYKVIVIEVADKDEAIRTLRSHITQ